MTNVGRMTELAAVAADLVDATDSDAQLTAAWAVHDALEARGLRCAGAFRDDKGWQNRNPDFRLRPGMDGGEARTGQNDEYWGADLSELVARAFPHHIETNNGPETIKIDLATLDPDVDWNGEITGWNYGDVPA